MSVRTFRRDRQVRLIGVRILVCSLWLSMAVSWAYSQPVLSTPSLSPVSGESFKMPVQMSGGQNIAELTFHLNYDGSVLSLPDPCADRVTTGEVVTSVIASCALENKIIVSLDCGGQHGCASEEADPVTLVEIDFDVIGSADCGLSFSDVDPAVQTENGSCPDTGGAPVVSLAAPGKTLNDSGQFVFLVDLGLENSYIRTISLEIRLDRQVDRRVCVSFDFGESPVVVIPPEREFEFAPDRTTKKVELEVSDSNATITPVIVTLRAETGCPDENLDGPSTEANVGLPNQFVIQPVERGPSDCFGLFIGKLICLSGFPGFDVYCGATFFGRLPPGLQSGSGPTTLFSFDGLATLRAFRDEVMLPSPTGRFYADLLEEMSLDLVIALLSPSSLTDQVFREWEPWVEGLQSVLDRQGDSFVITQQMIDGLLEILDVLIENGSAELKACLQ